MPKPDPDMDGIDLDAEWRICAREFTFADFTALAKLIGRKAAAHSMLILGAADIGVRGTRWRRQFRGERAIVVADMDYDWVENTWLKDMPGGGVPGGTNGYWQPRPRDLIAFSLETPRAYWPMLGTSWMLGFDSIEKANILEEPLRVHQCPLEWLRAEHDGLCVVEWNMHWSSFFYAIPALQFDDREFAGQAIARFQRPIVVPPAIVRAA